MFNIPEGYQCVVRSNDTTLYAYNNNYRDTYTFNSLSWQKSATSTTGTSYVNQICVESPQVPAQMGSAVFISATALLIAGLAILYKAIHTTLRSYF